MCSGSYTLCKKKSYLNQTVPRNNRTNVFTTSTLINSNLYNNSAYQSRRSINNFFDDYSTTQYYNNAIINTSLNSSTRPVDSEATHNNEPSISFINAPPPSYWQIMNQTNSTNLRTPPLYTHLNVTNLNKQNPK